MTEPRQIPTRLGLILSLCAIALSWSPPHPSVAASNGSVPTKIQQGVGESYWGPIPPFEESHPVKPAENKTPLWEHLVNIPWHIARLPCHLVAEMLGGTVAIANEYELYTRFRRLTHPELGPCRLAWHLRAGGLSGIGLGMSAKSKGLLGGRDQIKFAFDWTENWTRKATLGLKLPISRSDTLEMGGGYRFRPNARYFGLGPWSREAYQSFYTQETTWAGASLKRELGWGISADLGAIFSGIGTRGPGNEDDLALNDLAAAGAFPLPAGWREFSEGVSLELGVTQDNTTESGRPERGGIRRIKAAWFRSSNDPAVEFRTYRVELQQFYPLWYTKRSLAMRGVFSRIYPREGDVPFQRLLYNREPDLFRGFDDFRWRDRGLVSLTLEYRWPFWNMKTVEGAGADAFIFADFGQVFGDFEEIALKNVTTSFGFGIRLIDPFGDFIGRIDWGRSDETQVLRLRSDQVFQYDRGSPYYGRSPIPTR